MFDLKNRCLIPSLTCHLLFLTKRFWTFQSHLKVLPPYSTFWCPPPAETTHRIRATRTQPRRHEAKQEHHLPDHAHLDLPTVISTTLNVPHCQILTRNQVNNFCQTVHPKNSAAKALHLFFGTALSLMVTHPSVSDLSITRPHLHRPSSLALPSHQPIVAVHFLFIFFVHR